MICERVLEEEGVYDSLRVVEYQLDLIPLEDDVLTLALDSAYRECCLAGDRYVLFVCCFESDFFFIFVCSFFCFVVLNQKKKILIF